MAAAAARGREPGDVIVIDDSDSEGVCPVAAAKPLSGSVLPPRAPAAGGRGAPSSSNLQGPGQPVVGGALIDAAREVAQRLSDKSELILIVGPSGAGKTLVLNELRRLGKLPASSPQLACDPSLALVSHPGFKRRRTPSRASVQAVRGKALHPAADRQQHSMATCPLSFLNFSCMHSCTAGIGSIPAWLRPPCALSGGQQARAACCLRLQTDGPVAIDGLACGIEARDMTRD